MREERFEIVIRGDWSTKDWPTFIQTTLAL